jgi:hypothetical protein
MLLSFAVLFGNLALLLGCSRLIERDPTTWELEFAGDAYSPPWVWWVLLAFSALLSLLEAEIYLNWADADATRRVGVDAGCLVAFLLLYGLFRYFKRRGHRRGLRGEHPAGMAVLSLAGVLAVSWLVLHSR